MTNSGTVNWTAGDVNVAYQNAAGGPFVNQAGATWNISCDDYFAAAYSAGYPTYTNAYILNKGLVRKTANTGITEIGYHGTYSVLFKSSGKVEADAGTISFEGGYQDDGLGTLVFAPAGVASTNYGLISFSVKPVINGSLNLSLITRNGFSAARGRVSSCSPFPGATNWVNCLNGLDLTRMESCFNRNSLPPVLSLVANAY